MRELLNHVRRARREGRDVTFASVVETRGSTPQKPGAAMLIFPDGSQAGTLGGGCVEAEVRRQALELIGQTEPNLLVFTLDDDYGWDDGLICGGRMSFISQSVCAGRSGDYFDAFAELVDSGDGCTEAIVIDAEKTGLPVGARRLLNASGQPVAGLWGDQTPDWLIDGAEDLGGRPRPRVERGVAYLPILPRCRLLIVGAGHVGQAVAALAHQADFDVWVLDDRDSYACRSRFPDAQEIFVDDIGRWLKSFEPDSHTYCLIVTRGHSHDEEALYHLAAKPAAYVGMIGSKRKIKMIFQDLEKEGISTEALDRVYAPVGFDIGSQTVPEIAISIVAQLVGRRNLGADVFPPPRLRSATPLETG